jgi:hypothetical protein
VSNPTLDLQTGIVTVWTAAAALTALVPVTRFTFGTLGGSPTLPYCEAKIEKAADNEFVSPSGSGAPVFVTRRVTFSVKAATAESADAVEAAIHTAFNAEFAVPNSQNFDWRIDDDAMAELPLRGSNAQQVYEGKIVFLCTLVRTLP